MTRLNRFAGVFGVAAALAGGSLLYAQPGELPKIPPVPAKPTPPTPPSAPTAPAAPTAPTAPTTPTIKAPAIPGADMPAKADDKEKLVYVQMKTSMGDIVLELNAEKAPISVANFVKYTESGHYNGTVFHRVISTFMIQGGGFTPDLSQKETLPPIKNEWKNGLKNKRGTIAMGRTNVADSATSQFYINVQDNDVLDTPRDGAAYAVFGKVVSGMDVVDQIKVVKTGTKNGMGDVPVTPVVIEKVTKITADEAKAAPAKK